MRLTFPTLAIAAFALAASAAPTAETTTALPARFSLTTITAEPRANGLRVRVSANGSQLGLNVNGDLWPAVDASFRGGRGRIALDLSVHTNPLGADPPRPSPPNLGDWNVAFLPGGATLQLVSEQFQTVLDSWGPGYHPTVDTWVQDSRGTLRLLGADGVLRPNALKLCGKGAAAYLMRWDELYDVCPELELKVVPL